MKLPSLKGLIKKGSVVPLIIMSFKKNVTEHFSCILIIIGFNYTVKDTFVKSHNFTTPLS